MPHLAEGATQAALSAAAQVLADSLEVVEHCVLQLADEQIWWRPRPEMNSVGNLVLHLSGNLRQWIVSGLGGAADKRHRQQEFDARGPIAREALLEPLRQVVSESRDVLARLTAEEMLAHRTVQGFELTGWQTLFDTVPHFKGHTQEIVCLTRIQLGSAYRIRWTPPATEIAPS